MAGWGGYNLPAIWTMIERENACTGADRVLNWQGLAEAVREQHRRLQKARGELAAVWPPETNASARDFLEKVDLLAAHMEHTLTAAENTRVGLQGVIEALGTAQSTIRPLIEERAAAADDLVPRFVDHAEDKYDERAQRAMAEAEKAIAEHSAQIQAPSLFHMDAKRFPDSSDLDVGHGGSGVGSGGSGGVASGTGSGGAASVRATPSAVPIPNDVPPALAGHGESAPEGAVGSGSSFPGGPPESGLGLAGIAPVSHAALPAPSGAVPPGVPPPAIATPLPSGVTGIVGGMPGGVLPGGVLPGGVLPGPGGRGGPGGRQSVPTRRGLPSGAVIGATNAGPGAAGARAAVAPMMATPAGRPDGGAKDEGTSAGEPDQIWEVDRGVTPVIVPDASRAIHDPGPGVIGRDR